MESVDMVITQVWFSGRQSRSVNDSFQQPNFENLGLLVGLEASRLMYWEILGTEPPTKKGIYILHVNVGLHCHSKWEHLRDLFSFLEVGGFGKLSELYANQLHRSISHADKSSQMPCDATEHKNTFSKITLTTLTASPSVVLCHCLV